jgi:hypothetical protein
VVLDSVGRLTHRFDTAEELKLDAMLRFRVRRHTGGFGGGVRVMTIEGGDGRPGSTLYGLDLMRLAWNTNLARWEGGGRRIGIDCYAAWTFGFYSGELDTMPFSDVPASQRTRSIGMAESLTSTYVFGLTTSVTWP